MLADRTTHGGQEPQFGVDGVDVAGDDQDDDELEAKAAALRLRMKMLA
jgi:hypothetical protein